MKIDYQNRIFGLDLMRAIAILLVVCSHALWVFPDHESTMATLLRFGGMMGVEVFFVLSGFLIGRILLRTFTNESFHPKDFFYFLIRRWFRTFPNYYFALVFNIIIVIYLGRNLPETLPQYFGFLQNLFSGMDIFFTESWSLPVEEFAYILGPLLLYGLCFFKFKISRRKLFLFATLLILVVFFISKCVYNLEQNNNTADYWNINLRAVVIYRIDAIYYGVLAAYIARYFSKQWKASKEVWLFTSVFLFFGLHAAIGMFGWNNNSTQFLFNVLYFPICSILIALTLPVLSELKTAHHFLLKPITFISLISYSMYLLHYGVVLQLMNYWWKWDASNNLQELIFSISYLTAVIVLSYILYRWYEKPLMNLRDSHWFQKRFPVK